MATKLEIQDLLPDFEGFLTTAFDRRPVLYAEAMAGCLERLPTSADIDDLLDLVTLPADSVRLTRAGRGIPKEAFTSATGEDHTVTVDRDRLMQLFKSGATLTINDLQRILPVAQSMTRLLSRAFACRSEAAVFVTPAGKAGFQPHADDVGVIVVQAEGTKVWRVWPTDLSGPRSREAYTDAELGAPMFEMTLKPGDVLYMPHGTPHAAAAVHDQSIHISLMMRPRGWDEIIAALAARSLRPDWRQEFPALTDEMVPSVVSRLDAVLTEVSSAFEFIDPVEALRALRRDLVNNLVPEETDTLADMRRLDWCSTDQLFRVEPDAFEIIDEADGRCQVRVEGVTLTLPKIIVSALASGAETRTSLTCQQIYPEVPVGRAMSIAKQLTRLGALSLISAGRA